MTEKTIDKASLVQQEYFDLLSSYFPLLQSRLSRGCTKADVDAAVAAELRAERLIVARHSAHMPAALYQVEKLLQDVITFWQKRAAAYRATLAATDAFILGTLLNPTPLAPYGPLSLYFDHTLLPDPLLIQQDTLIRMSRSDTDFDITQFVAATLYDFAQLISFKDTLLDTGAGSPLLLYPTDAHLDFEVGNETAQEAWAYTSRLCSEIVQRDFSSDEERAVYLRSSDFSKLIKNQPLAIEVLGSADPTLLGHFTEVVTGMHRAKTGDRTERNDPTFVFMTEPFVKLRELAILGREFATSGFDPLILWDKWGVYKWLLDQQSRLSSRLLMRSSSEEHVAAAMMQSHALEWLGQIDLAMSRELRRRHSCESLREVFRLSRTVVRQAEPSHLHQAVAQAAREIDARLDAAASQISREAEAIGRSRVLGLASLGLGAAVGIASMIFPPLTIPGFLISIAFGAKSLRDVIQAERQGKLRTRELEARPLGVMVQLRHKYKAV